MFSRMATVKKTIFSKWQQRREGRFDMLIRADPLLLQTVDGRLVQTPLYSQWDHMVTHRHTHTCIFLFLFTLTKRAQLCAF